jgi:hypothetical protein
MVGIVPQRAGAALGGVLGYCPVSEEPEPCSARLGAFLLGLEALRRRDWEMMECAAMGLASVGEYDER